MPSHHRRKHRRHERVHRPHRGRHADEEDVRAAAEASVDSKVLSAHGVEGHDRSWRERLHRKPHDTLDVHRLEAGADVRSKWGSGYVRYLSDDQGINGAKIKNADVGGDINVTQHWGVSAYGNRDLIQNAWVIRDLGVFYKDECIRVDVFYRHEDVIIGRLGSSDQLSVRLTLATLGGPLYGR